MILVKFLENRLSSAQLTTRALRLKGHFWIQRISIHFLSICIFSSRKFIIYRSVQKTKVDSTLASIFKSAIIRFLFANESKIENRIKKCSRIFLILLACFLSPPDCFRPTTRRNVHILNFKCFLLIGNMQKRPKMSIKGRFLESDASILVLQQLIYFTPLRDRNDV